MKLIGTAIVIGLLTILVAACGSNGGNGSAARNTDAPTAAVASPQAQTGNDADCPEQSQVEEIPAAKLYIEYNSTDDDTGVHGLFDTPGFTDLCIYGPTGEQVLFVKPQGSLGDLGMGGIFFESREPVEAEVPQAATLAAFAGGTYDVVATRFEGGSFTGSATFSHDIPTPPVVTFPQEGDVVGIDNLVITWEPVTQTLAGDPAAITAYEVIVTDDRDEAEDPNGLARPILSAHVGPDVTSLTIPTEFLESGIEYELEVLALEESGNQTITVLFFETE